MALHKTLTHIQIHSRFKRLSRSIHPDLTAALTHVGPVKLKPRWRMSLPVLLCRAVAGQQLSVKAAASIWQRLRDQARASHLIDHIAVTTEARLRQCGLSAVKAKSLKAIAEQGKSGRLRKSRLQGLEIAERNQRLTSIYGVGQWTADIINIFYFLEPDVWPRGDVAVVKNFERFIDPAADSEEVSGQFAPYRSYLALSMWGYANNPPAG